MKKAGWFTIKKAGRFTIKKAGGFTIKKAGLIFNVRPQGGSERGEGRIVAKIVRR